MSPFDISAVNSSARTGAVSARDMGQKSVSAQAEVARSLPQGRNDAVRVETSATPTTGAPFDADRVSIIRNALRDGTYPIQPAKIADAMIAGRLLLSIPQ
ncbi:flagellar biosynthesis anti-sigma factor FlgM [uncultured Croceicoccus sp.]|uniref:flagellar biosynthesis anti-sigma factor FlgM n=1 Tax=uncultured Croceicoccus sp. TaxID=1295329 RepID=UPI002601A086|nr:flagellar biosynthesis anti-sigma factor FlgM [uncultured Croceicoccus sp.]